MPQLPQLELRPIERNDNPQQANDEMLRMFIEMTISHYEKAGFIEPWIGYVGLEDGRPVGVCGFKSQPIDGRVEIAYATLAGNEGRGVATAMAQELLATSQKSKQAVSVFAQTLPNENASTTILRKLGFSQTRTIEHPEDGTVWEWEQPTQEI